MRFIQSLLLLFVVFFPGIVHALGLGKIHLDSALNEPFEARIELLSANVEELDSLKIVLADDAAFSKAGIPRTAVLRQLRFVVKESEDGPDYVRIYTNEPVREPFLNFLVEVSWSKGRLYREYTVLLDPPIYASPQKQQRLAQPVAPDSAATGTIVREVEDNKVFYNPDYRPSTGAAPAAGYRTPTSTQLSYSGGDYGPVVSGDTLWSIAKAMRPDSSVSIQQMMLALLRANPEAFINNNINGLKRGFVLQMPDMSDVTTVNKDTAFTEAKLQNELWQEARGALATTVTPRPETTVTQPEEPAAKPEEPVVTEQPAPVAAPVEAEVEPELRLVAPAEEGEVAGEGEQSTGALTQELALANETLEALKLENVELKDKLSETEVIIDDLKRLIVLKEEELAALQQKIAEQQAQAEAEKQKQAEMAAAKAAEEPVKADKPKPAEAVTEEEKAEPAPAEEVSEEKPAEEEPVAAAPSSFVPSALMGLVDQFKNNLPLSAAVPGGAIILILLIVMLIQRRSSATAVEIPQSAFPEFDDLEATEGPEDATDINPALAEEESESETILPGSEDETVTPDFEGEKTKVVAARKPEPVAARKPEPAAAAEPEPDAFDLSAAEEEAEDPLAEVNVFLAYEHFDQAEEFVKKAIEKEPDNLEFHNKLLEVFYAANNKKGYEQAAKVLHDKVGGQGDYWNMAVAMWQEISPNRELFAEPSEEEEEAATTTTGGGIVNIAGEGEGASAALDFDLDTTAAGGEELLEETSTAEEEADVLDVTAAVDMEDDAVLDVTSASESDDGSMDLAFDMDESPGEEPAAEESLDISLDAGSAPPEESSSEEDNSLDFSFDMDTSAKEEPAAEEALDISLDTEPEKEAEAGGDMDISLDFPAQEEKAEPAEEDDSLDFSLDTGSESAAEEDNALDLSLDAPGSIIEETEESSAGEEVSLDLSMDMEVDAEPAESKTEVTNAGADLLDVTTALSMDEDESADKSKSGEDIMDISDKAGGDLLDVTKSSEFELDNNEDLLDVTTSATGAGLDADELMEGEEEGAAKGESAESEEPSIELDDSGLDFELSPDDGAKEGEQELSFDGIDITAGAEGAEQDLDFNIETGSDEDSEEMDMDATMQIPSKRSDLSLVNDDSADDSSAPELVLDEEDDGDHTIMVPRSSGTAEQSEADEIATQLDLAKAYVELGDKENARTILDEIIAIGNDEQKQQAQELLSQI